MASVVWARVRRPPRVAVDAFAVVRSSVAAGRFRMPRRGVFATNSA